MKRRCLLTLGAIVLGACANSGAILFPDGAKVVDAGDGGDDAPDVQYDVPQFDIPQRDVVDVSDEEAAVDVASEPAIDVSDAAFDASDAASDASDVITRDVSDAGRVIDHCYVTDPRTMDLLVGSAGQPIGVAVFVSGVTSGAGRGADVSVEVGVGPGGSAPLATGSGWVWAGAAYDRDIDGRGATGARDYDRYQGAFPLPSMPGEYAYAARARLAKGPWVACDFVQTTPHSYDPVFAGRLTVAASGAPRVGYCNLQFPRTLSLAASTTSATPVYGRVFAAGVTNRGCTDMPLASELGAQWGYGPSGSFPTSATWTWIDGRYNDHRDTAMALGTGNCQNVEYAATPRAPVDCNTRSYGWRFRLGTGPWTYCRWAPPADGAPSTPPFDTWDPSLAGAMTVTSCL